MGMKNLAKIERAIHLPIPRSVGRPSTYTKEVAARICVQLINGRTLTAICRAPGMPHRITVLRWCDDNEEFRNAYERARDRQQDFWAEETVDLANNVNAESRFAIEKARLRIDTRKWITSKLKASRYGERNQVNVSGEITLTDIIRDSYQRPAIDVTPESSAVSPIEYSAEPAPVERVEIVPEQKPLAPPESSDDDVAAALSGRKARKP